MNKLLEKINECTTRKSLDKLRLEILNDTVNFEENKRAFINKQRLLRDQGKSRRKEGYTLMDVAEGRI